jgi:hypothetical protein
MVTVALEGEMVTGWPPELLPLLLLPPHEHSNAISATPVAAK